MYRPKNLARLLVGETHRTPPLYGYEQVRHSNAQKDPESLPSKEGMRKVYGWNRKEFGENFAPLLGFLHKNTGRHWDKVQSEMLKSFQGEGGVQIQHVFVHLWQFVERNPDYSTGKPAHPVRWGRRPHPFTSGEWYIDKFGVLREGRDAKKKVQQPKPPTYVKSSTNEFLKVKGAWFRIETGLLPEAQESAGAIDVVVGGLHAYNAGYRAKRYKWAAKNVDMSRLWDKYSAGGTRHAVRKRALNSREIRRLKLR